VAKAPVIPASLKDANPEGKKDVDKKFNIPNGTSPLGPKKVFVAAAVWVFAAKQYQPAEIVWLIVISYSVLAAVHDTVPASNSTVLGRPSVMLYIPIRITAVPLKFGEVFTFIRSIVIV
jgi:hypothetical protein